MLTSSRIPEELHVYIIIPAKEGDVPETQEDPLDKLLEKV